MEFSQKHAKSQNTFIHYGKSDDVTVCWLNYMYVNSLHMALHPYTWMQASVETL